ncbi:unnamed protein product [Owenia fusiformis]|uniref:Uncharacterized protein n=1 Tax=Owenia fusiformis TaxID=6347 RepID=A0A8J1XQ39_OWEFU|nr:unnamed protein product [Owenia fusiformis]
MGNIKLICATSKQAKTETKRMEKLLLVQLVTLLALITYVATFHLDMDHDDSFLEDSMDARSVFEDSLENPVIDPVFFSTAAKRKPSYLPVKFLCPPFKPVCRNGGRGPKIRKVEKGFVCMCICPRNWKGPGCNISSQRR